MDAMENDNRNLRNNLSDLISDDENEELSSLGTMRSDANFNGLHEEYSAAAGFHHSQFSDPTVSSHPNITGSFSDSISYSDIDWSFDGSQLGLSSQNWPHSIFTDAKNKTNSSLHIRRPELPSIYRVSMRSQAAEGLHIIECERERNNHNLQPSGCEEQIGLNITAICSGFQPHCFEKLDAESLDGCQTKATAALNKTDKIISGFKDNTGDVPNLTTFSENSVGVKCSNFINFSLHPSSVYQPSIRVDEDNPFPTPSNKEDLGPAEVQCNGDVLNPPQIAATSMTTSSNNQIGLSSQSWFTDLESCLLRRDQTQWSSEQQSHTSVMNLLSEFSTFAPSLGIPAAISVPNQSFELEQSAGPSQPPQNVGNGPTSGNRDTREFRTIEDSSLAKSYPNPTCSSSSPSLPNPPSINSEMSFRAHLAQFLSSHDPIEYQKTNIDLNFQKQEQVSQLIISERVSLISSKFEDLRDHSFRQSRASPCYIKCQDLDQTPKLCGQRCYPCKRDLSFKPEGSLVLPKILPPVAVLPCSHVFHDFCLDRITPQNQAEDPPCISCAVGET